MRISLRLEEAVSNYATQDELNTKREGERDNNMADLGEQIDRLNGNKAKSEKDRAGMELDLLDARLDLEGAVKGKAVYPCGSSI